MSRELPIVCTLNPGELAARRDELLPGLTCKASDVTPIDGGFRLRFDASSDMLASILRVVDAERRCCAFLRFQLTVEPGGDPFTLEITGPPGSQEMLRELAGTTV